jgi:putative ABC transport system ATP-binding protein
MPALAPNLTIHGLGALRSASKALTPAARVLRLAALEREDLAVIAIYAAARGLVSLAVPAAAQALVNAVASTALVQPVAVLSVLVFVGLLVGGAIAMLQYRVAEVLQQRFFVRLAHDAAHRIARADVYGLKNTSSDEWMQKFMDVAVVQKSAASLLLDGASVVLQGSVSLVILAFYHPAFLAFALMLSVFIALTFVGLGRGGVETAIKESKAKYDTANWLNQMAQSVVALKSPGGDQFAFQRADSLARTYVQARGKHFKIVQRQLIASQLLQAFGTASLLGLGGYLVLSGQLTLGQLVAAELIATGVLAGVAKFGKYLESYYDLAASVDKLSSIIDAPEEPEEGASRGVHGDGMSLEFIDVCLAIDGDTDALSNLNLAVKSGEQVAVIGASASGKSSLVDLAYGLRAASSGRILMDGVDVRTLRKSALRAEVAIVGKPSLFDLSVYDNLSLGGNELSADRVAHLLEAVALSGELERLPHGLATRLGSLGNKLTPSQASRLAIARAIGTEPRLLIIDGTLDGIDRGAAKSVLDAIAREAHAPTLIVLTSREDIACLATRVHHLVSGNLRTATTETV